MRTAGAGRPGARADAGPLWGGRSRGGNDGRALVLHGRGAAQESGTVRACPKLRRPGPGSTRRRGGGTSGLPVGALDWCAGACC